MDQPQQSNNNTEEDEIRAIIASEETGLLEGFNSADALSGYAVYSDIRTAGDYAREEHMDQEKPLDWNNEDDPKATTPRQRRSLKKSSTESLPPPPPPPPPPPTYRNPGIKTFGEESQEPLHAILSSTKPSPGSLDFERVVNEYSIQATRDRLFVRVRKRPGTVEGNASSDDESLPILPSNDEDDEDYTDNEITPDSRRGSQRKQFSFKWKQKPKPTPLGYTGRTATRWILTNTLGVLTGLISIVLVSATEVIQKWRSELMDRYLREETTNDIIFLMYAGTNLTLALLSAALCLFLAPQAVGSGIPEVKAFLNGVRVQRFANLRLFGVKIVATILSVSSGLAIGPEGPLVHIGAILGASETKLLNGVIHVFYDMFACCWGCLSCAFWKRRSSKSTNNPSPAVNSTWKNAFLTDLSFFSTDAERRDLVSIGAACGFAAAFGAPIGGLLFSLEEASSYFDQTMFLKTLAATTLATFLLAVHHGDLSKYSVISLGTYHTPNQNIFLYRVEELPLYIVIGVGGGLLGGLFCRIWKFLQLSRQARLKSVSNRRAIASKLVEVALVSLLTSTLTYYIPLMDWTCRPVNVNDDVVDVKSVFDPWQFHKHQFDCERGHINELATIFFGSREDAISDILTDPAQFQTQTLLVTGVLFFVLMTLTLGVSLPSGIFMPTFLIGSSLGAAAGNMFQMYINPQLQASVFALLGAAALLAGIQRSTVSICVILVEGTGQVKTLLPVIVTVVTARYIGDLVTRYGLYETAMIEVQKYPYLEHEEHKKYDVVKVRDIMSAPAVTLAPIERAQNIVQLLKESNHHGFPVVDNFSRKFLGLVRRDQLVALIESGVFDDDDNSDDASSVMSDGSTHSQMEWTPRPGVGKSPLMNLAYHIKDDRYDDIIESDSGLVRATLAPIESDAFDSLAWFLSVRYAREAAANSWYENDDSGALSLPKTVTVGDESFPPWNPFRNSLKGMKLKRETDRHGPTCVVGTNRNGSVYVQWLHPSLRHKRIRICSVMNVGTYCVTETCPVSKAHHLFTALGLRHLIVLGGPSGGEVVGVLTRLNLLKDYIQPKTKWEL